MRERYAAVLGHTPRVLFGLPQSWEPLLHVIRHPSYVHSIAFSPNGGRLASGSDEIVRIWNTATGELEDELEGHTDPVESVTFSHDGHFIVSGSWDKTVRIWNTATCETTNMLMGHMNAVTSVAISRDDKFVVSGSDDKMVRIWDTETGKLLHELEGHADMVTSVAVSPDCQHIASGSLCEAWIWTKDGVIEHKLEQPTTKYHYVSDLVFSHDGRRILCNYNKTEWTTTGHRLSTLDPNEYHDIISIAYSPPNDDEIVCGLGDGTIMIWKETDETYILGRHSYRVNSIAFSPDGSRIASTSDDGIRIWDPSLRGTFTEEDLGLLRVALSCDGQWIVTALLGHIQVWRVTETMTKTNELTVETDELSIALSRDGSRVVIGCRDGSIQVWNHLTNTIECQMSGHSHRVVCVAFSYDGSHVVSGSDDKTVRIWDYHTGNEVDLHQHSESDHDWVMCLAFSRDGGCVAFGSYKSGTWMWNPSTGRIYSGPSSKTDYMHSIAFSYDGNHVISGWEDGGVWIWDVTTNESTELSDQIQLPDGTRVHSLGKDHFHIRDPVDKETTNDVSPYLLSISQDRDWITGEEGEHICWIAPQYRAFTKAHVAESTMCLQTRRGMIVLDLKNTPRAERFMPGV